VNSDARVDLLEAVYALQTVSGLRPQPIDPKFENTVNFTLDSANIEASGNGLSLFNARLQSDNVSIEDSVDIEMEFSNGGFSVKSVVIHEEVGVYYDWLFAKDVTTEIAMEIDSQTYEMNRSYSFRTNQEDRFIFNLEKGQVLSWTISGPNVEYNYSFCSADENGNCLEELRNLSGEAYQSVISWPVEILTSGKYALKVWPLDNSGFVNFGLKFLNANRRQLVEVENGAKLSASLARNLRDYAKYKINGCNPII
jgi:hypothetical protein